MPDTPFKRLLKPPENSFFLFGPRSVGKSSWLETHFQGCPFFDLLESGTHLEFSRNPGLLEARIGEKPPGTWVCIDEIQKLPGLLTEVHRLIEKKKYRFAMSGSSARKLKRGGADLLAGRAITQRLEGFSATELGKTYNLRNAIEWGTLPLVTQDIKSAPEILAAYVHTYLREEIKEEGLVRRAEPFIRFLEIAALMNGQQLNKENVARDAKVPRSTVDLYFSILEDTLLGHFLQPYRPEAKVREQAHPKFYWFDPGVARGAAGLLYDPLDPLRLGWALETLIFHELRVYNEVQARHRPIYYYRTGAGSEIDFVIETRKRTSSAKARLVCLEIKHSKKWDRSWERPMRDFAAAGKITVEKMFGIYLGNETYRFNGLDVLPFPEFLKQLYEGKIF